MINAWRSSCYFAMKLIIFPEQQLNCAHKHEKIQYKSGAIKNNFGLIPNLMKRNVEFH